MKWPLWKKVLVGVPAGIILLLAANAITDAHRERILQTQVGPDQGGAFGPKQVWAAQSPGAALMEALTPARPLGRRVSMTMGLDRVGQADKASAPAAKYGSSPLKLIRTGQVSVEVGDFEKAAKELGKLVESLGGYVADTQVQRSPSGARSGSITLRVPAVAYEAAGSKIRTLGKILSEKSNVQDVTKAYLDLETKLRVKREALNRIRELLRTRTGNLKDVLEAEQEITRISEEIDLAEGERQYFDHQINLSTLVVDLAEPEHLSFARPSSWAALSEALRDSMAMVAGSLAFMLRLVLILLPWALAGLGLAWVVRWWRRRLGPSI
jgi:hypothetical protein